MASQQLELQDPPVIIYYSFIMKSYTKYTIKIKGKKVKY